MAKKKRKKIASRGSVNDIILKTLVGGDKYGYEIIKEVENYSDGKIILKQPSLYSSLTRFEEKGYVSSYWGDSDIGGRRHYYHLTEMGQNYYDSQIKSKEVDKLKSTTNVPVSNAILKSSPTTLEVTTNESSDVLESPTNTTDTIVEVTQTTHPNLPSEQILEEVDIPAFVDFEQKDEKPQEIVFDHNFHANTPIEQEIEEKENNSDNSTSNIAESVNILDTQSQEKQNEDEVWQRLSDLTKINNKKCANSSNRRLHYIRPKKSQKVILDVDGIYKLRDADYVPKKSTSSTKIIDNVGKRIENKNMGYAEYTKTQTRHQELTEEERRLRNENFLAKFNSLTKTRLKPVEPPKPEPKVEQKEIDYRSKLDIFQNSFDEPEVISTPEPQPQNNLFNYIEDDQEPQVTPTVAPTFDNSNVIEDEDDKFIDFDPVDFETKPDDSKYVEEISNFQPRQDNLKISKYQSRTDAILTDKTYVLINKVKCLFGFVLMLMMITEVTISLFIFKKYDVIGANDKTLLILAYVISAIVSLCFMLPTVFNPNEHKINNFKLKYAMIFGILTFLVSIVLVYCINSLVGFELDNFKYFAVKMILPLVLTFNFVIAPPIYGAIIKSKKFYD
ncbi:MAG: helix-turn-helix transcriptional regulator [Firmicutes bacterium]|nr:helix-turn-helix transcriptional regulator [Bacillota bacterium]